MTASSSSRPLRASLSVLATLAMLATMLVGLASTASAATFTVTRGDDPNPGACLAADCSLREAIMAANGAAGADIIALPAGHFVVDWPGVDADDPSDDEQGDIDVFQSLTIQGAGSGETTIDGLALVNENDDRIFHVHGATALTLADLTLANGESDVDGSGGGAVYLEDDDASLTADDVVFSQNIAYDTSGGAILVDGEDVTVTLNGGELHANHVEDGGSDAGGGAIALIGDGARLDVNGTRARGNVADAEGGGVVYVSGANADITVDDAFWGSDVSTFPGVPPQLPDVAAENSFWGLFEQLGTSDRPIIVDDEGGFEIANVPHPDGNRSSDASGGVFYFDTGSTGSTLTITDSRMDGNRSDSTGGVIAVGRDVSETVDDISIDVVSTSLWGNKDGEENNHTGGGAIAIYSGTTTPVELTLDDVYGAQNNTDSAGGVVLNYRGNVTITDSLFENNKVDWSDGVTNVGVDGDNVRASGGVIANAFGTLDISDSTFRANKSDMHGGAIYDFRGTVTISRSIFDRNKADGRRDNSPSYGDHGQSGGGAILSGAGDVTITASAITNNKTDNGGGGVNLTTQNDGDAGGATDDFGSLTIANSTISSNIAGEDHSANDEGAGAAVYNDSGQAELTHVTVFNNRGVYDESNTLHESIFNYDDEATPTTTITQSALGSSPGQICQDTSGGNANFVSGGNNVADDDSCFADAGTDEVVADIGLLELSDNGGDNGWTHEPRSNSPVVDHVAPADCPPPANDQRGVNRPRGASCDAGAVELVAGTDLAVAISDSPDPVTVGDAVTYTIVVTNNGPNLAEDVTLEVSLPNSGVFSGASSSCGSPDGSSLSCDLGNIASGASKTVTVTVTSTATGAMVLGATVDAEFQTDTAPANDTDTESTTVREPTGGPGPGPDTVIRYQGETRIQTATAISQATFGDNGASSVVLARADLFPDGLAGTPLAISRNAPILLTPTESLHRDTEAEILRVLQPGGTVYVLGGSEAIDPAVSQRLVSLSYRVTRLSGADRYQTATRIARELGNPSSVMVVVGTDFADALAAGPAAAVEGASILLTEKDRKTPTTASYIASLPNPTVFAVGGPDVNPYARSGADEEVFGQNRFETATAVADRFFTDPVFVGVARSDEFADALSGGAHIGRIGGPIVLTPTITLADETGEWLCANQANISFAFIYGGPEAIDSVVQQEVRKNIQGSGC